MGPHSLLDLIEDNWETSDMVERRLARGKDPNKSFLQTLLQLCHWLADSKPPSTSGWTGKSGNARKFKGEMDEAIQKLTYDMILGKFWCRQLTGWKQFVACLLAIINMCNPLMCQEKKHLECAVDVLVDCKERKDVSVEAKWQAVHDWLHTNDPCQKAFEIIRALQNCVDNDEAPREVVAMLKGLTVPPGFKSAMEQAEIDRQLRAKEAEDDGFDLTCPHEELPHEELPREELPPEVEQAVDQSVLQAPLPLAPLPAARESRKRQRVEDSDDEEGLPVQGAVVVPQMHPTPTLQFLADDIANIQAAMKAAADKAIERTRTSAMTSGIDTSDEGVYWGARAAIICEMISVASLAAVGPNPF